MLGGRIFTPPHETSLCMVLSFPASLLLLPAAVLLGVVYVTLGWRFGGSGRGPSVSRSVGRSVGRSVSRALVLGVTWSAPLFIAGPGPAKLTLGLLVGFAGIRMVALGERWRTAVPPPSAGKILFSMVSLEDLFARVPGHRAPPWRISLATTTSGLIAVATCIGLMFAGNRWQIWRASILGDDVLVLVEVAVGAAGIHRVIVGAAGLLGRSVAGLQDRPLRSASLTEFWGRRWNRLVQANLNRAFFRPRSRLGPRRGIVAAFTASGIMHAIAVVDAAHLRETWLPTLAVMAFFWLHAAGVLAERRWGGTPAFRLSPSPRPPLDLLAHARTVVLLVLISPLLLEPFAAVVHLHGRPAASAWLTQNFRLTPTVP